MNEFGNANTFMGTPLCLATHLLPFAVAHLQRTDSELPAFQLIIEQMQAENFFNYISQFKKYPERKKRFELNIESECKYNTMFHLSVNTLETK